MELGLSLGDESASNPFMFLSNQQQQQKHSMSNGNGILKESEKISGVRLDMCMGLGGGGGGINRNQNDENIEGMVDQSNSDEEEEDQDQDVDDDEVNNGDDHRDVSCLQQLDLLPLLSSVPTSCPSSSHNNHRMLSGKQGFNVTSLLQLGGGGGGVAGEVTSANSVASARFPLDFDLFKGGGGIPTSGGGGGTDGKDDDEDETYINGVNAKKKLRLSKEQSAYLEESFKEHHTLNPKQKLALAKQLNLRPRQIEVWFQNRRARTKLKQTEVDCEYLKRCCETLTEENKRLHKKLQELRVLKTSNPFYMQVPATTLTMCSSCEKVTTTTTTSTTSPSTTTTNSAIVASATNPITTTTTTATKAVPFPLSRSTRHYPFSQKTTNHRLPHEASTS